MELPFNTVYSQDILGTAGRNAGGRLADQAGLGRLRLRRAAGRRLQPCRSAYTLVKDQNKVNFSYRDNLWHGGDLLATGVASFGHVSGVHYQNLPEWADYLGALGARRAAAVARHATDAASVAGPRVDPAAQDRVGSTPATSATSSASTISTTGATSGSSTSTTAG